MKKLSSLLKKPLSKSVASGLLLWIGWPPARYTTFLLLIGLVPMLLALEDRIQSPSKRPRIKILWTSFLGFFVWNTLSGYWVYHAIKMVGPLFAIPISLLLLAFAPFCLSLVCCLYYELRKVTTRNWGLVGLVCAWIAYEYLCQSWEAFPWMTLGNGFATSHQWIQWYEYTGVYGGSIWIWSVNAFIFLIYHHCRGYSIQTRRKLFIFLAGLILIPLGISLIRYKTHEERIRPLQVVLVQPNVNPLEKARNLTTNAQTDSMIALSEAVANQHTELFIWPETAITEAMDEAQAWTNPHYLQVRQFLNKYKNSTLVTGWETYQIHPVLATPTARWMPEKSLYIDNFNSAIAIENTARVQFYHKSKLVPGVEFMPFSTTLSFLKPTFEHLGGSTSGYGRQAGPSVFYTTMGVGLAPVICYESIFGAYVGAYVKKGAQCIAIITNDAWWEDTAGKDQHLSYAKLRAIETRRWVCRSANTGISAFISQRGDVVQHAPWGVKTALQQSINLNSTLTFYTRAGDYIAKAAVIITSVGLLFLVLGLCKRKILIK